jgi:RNA polymerase sigma-70 factor (ECF subfamily)
MSSDGPDASNSAGKQHFATTQWSIVVAAGRGGSVESSRALAVLCSAYWFPLYAFVRRSGYSVSDAEDLTQAFFGRFLEKEDVAAAVRDRGKFRSFLLAAMKHFLANERDRAQAQKRGGGRLPVSLDFKSGESRYQIEPSHELTAEKLFDQQWAVALLDRVLTALRQEYADGGKEELFDHLKTCLVATSERLTYSQLAGRWGMTEGAVKVAVHRLRQRYRERLRAEIGQTVTSPEEVEDEIRDLFGAFEA